VKRLEDVEDEFPSPETLGRLSVVQRKNNDANHNESEDKGHRSRREHLTERSGVRGQLRLRSHNGQTFTGRGRADDRSKYGKRSTAAV
jgi:hypothetical protein